MRARAGPTHHLRAPLQLLDLALLRLSRPRRSLAALLRRSRALGRCLELGAHSSHGLVRCRALLLARICLQRSACVLDLSLRRLRALGRGVQFICQPLLLRALLLGAGLGQMRGLARCVRARVGLVACLLQGRHRRGQLVALRPELLQLGAQPCSLQRARTPLSAGR
jgi:hypothetical protein